MDVRIYSPDFRPRGVLPVLGGTVVLRHNNVSTFSIDVNGNSPLADRMDTGWHIALYEDGVQHLTGTPDAITRRSQRGVTDITLSGRSHMRWLADMITIPTPAAGITAQGATSHYKASGPSETVIRNLVRTHVGQSARSEHRRPIIVDARGDRGKRVSITSRFQPLLDEVRTLAKLGGTRFFTRMEGTQVRFSQGVGMDLSRAVRLSEVNGAVESWEYAIKAPTVTDVLVAGQGEGTARTLRHATGNPNQWGVRALVFQDRRDTDEAAELDQAGRETLEDGQETASITLDLIDLPRLRFGKDFLLGDTITVQVGAGTITDVVQSAEITWGADGRSVKLQVGPTQDEMDAPGWVKAVHRLRTSQQILHTT